ncbi:MAG: hypothetical protein J5617_03940 [Bacilli bacterium]|nr:hypothetical protein [Bacilli bacterium]
MLWIIIAILIYIWIKKQAREDEEKFKKDMEEFERIHQTQMETMANLQKYDLSPELKEEVNRKVEEMNREWEALKASE